MMTKILNKRLCAILSVFAIALLAATIQAADKKDTPEDVMRAGKLASAEITRLIGESRQRASNADAKTRADLSNQITALTRLQPLMSRLGQNRTFAAQVLDLSLKNDKPGLAALWEKEVTGCKIQIREIKDWWFYGVFEVDGHLYEVSAGSDTGFRITPLGRAKT